MREPVAFKKIDTAVTLSPVEALASSLNFYGKVDMGYMAQATNKEEEEIIDYGIVEDANIAQEDPNIPFGEEKTAHRTGTGICKCQQSR